MKITAPTRFFPAPLRASSSSIRRNGHSIREELAAAFGPDTKAIILNTPNNPTGKVFARAELETNPRSLRRSWNAFAITDEIYEHMLYDGAQHISMATLDGMRDRTITINALSKTYSVTGWRVGWAIAPPEVTSAIRKVHDFLTVGAAAPLQEAGAVALQFPPDYYETLADEYARRRERLLGILTGAGFHCFKPARRVLHHDGHLRLRFPGRRSVRQISGHRNRRRRRPRLQLLSQSRRRPHPSPLHLLQNRKDIPGRRRTSSQITKSHLSGPWARTLTPFSRFSLCTPC